MIRALEGSPTGEIVNPQPRIYRGMHHRQLLEQHTMFQAVESRRDIENHEDKEMACLLGMAYMEAMIHITHLHSAVPYFTAVEYVYGFDRVG